MARSLLRLAPLLLLMPLGSCSYLFDLRAVAIDGRLAFIVDPASSHEPDCVRRIDVSADDGEPPARPAPGDDRALVLNGNMYWWAAKDYSACDANPFPIFYGAELKGAELNDPGFVAPKPLKIGVVYQVSAADAAGGYGSGWFKILPGGRIENYREDPTPPARDENGFIIIENEAT